MSRALLKLITALDPPGAQDGVVEVRLVRDEVELAHLLLERHAAQEILDAALDLRAR
jgi:hypothetical protein